MEPLSISSSTSLEDSKELVHRELYREIKGNCILAERTIYTTTRVEVRIDQDLFDGGIAVMGNEEKLCIEFF